MSSKLSPTEMPETQAVAAGPLAAYRQRVADGQLAADPEQQRAAARLDQLFEELRTYPAAHAARRGLRGLFGRASRTAARPRGVYLVGDVGRGKSMLMDLFFEVAPVRRKQRIHFHRFMQDAHRRLHAMKRADPSLTDPIPPLAQAISTDAILLCFDEFQVNDITDAMILGRLFDALFERGVVVVATSNTRPEDLFQGRPGSDAFRPFIATIRREMDTVLLDSPRDYRRGGLRGMATWHVPADARAELRLDAAFDQLAEDAVAGPETLTVMGRPFVVPLAAGGVARFDFETLCDRPLGAGDYLALASRYPALVIDGVPRLGPENFDVARRFIVLVDALYEQKVKLVASAADRPDRIFQRGEGAKAFERTASRLEEMQSQAYLDLPHLP
ncbi:cell division protein ZapE [Lichenicoccus roseus]|uniref:AFG1 family ATPase n=1 Tax=Lichenicoccus roseus TaxID=2683649 RepID=A0A5R9J6C4_9PROT|nr:cell division protein ZapE [Lichenicoccus roseus]TLU73165.1 AFG1 family ATPase [Lichenicoccus roseus]